MERDKKKRAHPQEQISAIEETEELTVIITIGIHIARRIGEAVARAYKGDMSLPYGDKKTIQVLWRL